MHARDKNARTFAGLVREERHMPRFSVGRRRLELIGRRVDNFATGKIHKEPVGVVFVAHVEYGQLAPRQMPESFAGNVAMSCCGCPPLSVSLTRRQEVVCQTNAYALHKRRQSPIHSGPLEVKSA